jgi:hypothetical protein
VFSTAHDLLTAESPQSLFRMVGLPEPTTPIPVPVPSATPAVSASGSNFGSANSTSPLSDTFAVTPLETGSIDAATSTSFPSQISSAVANSPRTIVSAQFDCSEQSSRCKQAQCDCTVDLAPQGSAEANEERSSFCDSISLSQSGEKIPTDLTLAFTSESDSSAAGNVREEPARSSPNASSAAMSIPNPLATSTSGTEGNRRPRSQAKVQSRPPQQLFDLSSVSNEMPALGESPLITPIGTPVAESSVPATPPRTSIASVWGKSVLKIPPVASSQPPSPSAAGNAVTSNPTQSRSGSSNPRQQQNAKAKSLDRTFVSKPLERTSDPGKPAHAPGNRSFKAPAPRTAQAPGASTAKH